MRKVFIGKRNVFGIECIGEDMYSGLITLKCICGNAITTKRKHFISRKQCDECRIKNTRDRMLKDYIGERFGKLIVIKESEDHNNVVCKCDCGRIENRKLSTLIPQKSKGSRIACNMCMLKSYDYIIGKRFKRLIVKSIVPREKGKKGKAICLCDCGNTTIVPVQNLINGSTHSCGCRKKETLVENSLKTINNIIGKRIGMITIIGEKAIVSKQKSAKGKQRIVTCKCSCGTIFEATLGNIMYLKQKSCGCLRRSKKRDYIKDILDETLTTNKT